MIKQLKDECDISVFGFMQKRKKIFSVINCKGEKEFFITLGTHTRDIQIEAVFQNDSLLELDDVTSLKELNDKYEIDTEIEVLTKSDICQIYGNFTNQKALHIFYQCFERQIMTGIKKHPKFDSHLYLSGVLDTFYFLTGKQTITYFKAYNEYTLNEMLNLIDGEYLTIDEVKLYYGIY